MLVLLDLMFLLDCFFLVVSSDDLGVMGLLVDVSFIAFVFFSFVIITLGAYFSGWFRVVVGFAWV